MEKQSMQNHLRYPDFLEGVDNTTKEDGYTPSVLSERISNHLDTTRRKFVFVSYSHHDKERVFKDLIKLEKIYANYWYDNEFKESYTSVQWNKNAEEIILNPNCAGILFYVSQESFISDSVYTEVCACLKRMEKDKSFSHKVIFLENDNIFDIQSQCVLQSNFSSKRLIDLHTLWGSEIIHIKYMDSGTHIREVVKWFVKLGCLNDVKYDVDAQTKVCEDYLLVGKTLISYYGQGEVFSLKDDDHITKISTKAIASPYVKKVVIPEGVTEIEDFAIVSCTSLEEISIPSSVIKLHFFALSNFNFSSIEISPDNPCYKTDKDGFVYSIDDERRALALFACPNKSKIEVLRLEESVLSINDFAISFCNNLTKVEFSRNLKHIGHWGVRGNPKLDEIVLFPGIEYIAPEAFFETNIKTVIFKGTEEEWKKHGMVNEKDTLCSYFSQATIKYDLS